MKDNIILTGFMGCGKTTIGKALSETLSYAHIDTDWEIEKAEKTSINNIFKEKGEEYFRKLETETIRELEKTLNRTIVSTGGGLPLRRENADILKQMGFVIYLKVSGETVWERLKNDKKRPLLKKPSPREEIGRLMEYRGPLYEVAAHMVIEADGKDISGITEEIIRNFNILRSKDSLS